MKEFVISEAKAECAILVGLITKDQDEAKTKEYLDELEFLADTAGAVTVKRYTQQRRRLPARRPMSARASSKKSETISRKRRRRGWSP